MLQSIRDHTQGWIAGVIISLLIFSFALWGIHSYIGTGGNSDIIANVNGQEISKHQVTIVYERLRRQLQAQAHTVQLPVQEESALKNRALQSIIETEALKESSLANDYYISNLQVDSFLETLPEFQENGHFSASKFRTLLENNLYSPVDFINLVKNSLLIDQPRLGIMFSSFALPYEIEQATALVNQERNFKYLALPFDLIKKESINIPEDKIKTYYSEHEDLFKSPEQVSIEYVELDFNNILGNIHPTDEQLNKFAAANSSNLAQAKKAYTQQLAEEKFGEIKEKLASISYEHPESLNPVAKDLGLKIQTTGLFTSDQGNPQQVITNNPKIREAAFSDDVLHRQNNSDVIQLNNEQAIVLRVKNHSEAQVLSLSQVKSQIIDKLKQEDQAVKLKQLAESIQQQLSKGLSADPVLASYNLTWKDPGFVKRTTTTVDSSILETAFSMPQPSVNKSTFDIAKTPSGYAVIMLNAVKKGVSDVSNQDKVYAEQVQNAQAFTEYELYKNSIIRNAKIKIEGE